MAEPVLERFGLTFFLKKHTFSLKNKNKKWKKIKTTYVCRERERERKKEIETGVNISG